MYTHTHTHTYLVGGVGKAAGGEEQVGHVLGLSGGTGGEHGRVGRFGVRLAHQHGHLILKLPLLSHATAPTLAAHHTEVERG